VTSFKIAVAIAGFGDQNARALKSRWPIVAVSLIAASAFALSVQDGAWWSIGGVEIGPHGTRSPFAGATDLRWMGDAERWARFGTATWAAGLIAMFVLIVVAGGLAANRTPRLAARTALVAIATALAVGTMFVLGRPDNGMVMSVGRGLYLFGAAILTGVVAAVSVLRAPRQTGG
jgi:hypothetical protein